MNEAWGPSPAYDRQYEPGEKRLPVVLRNALIKSAWARTLRRAFSQNISVRLAASLQDIPGPMFCSNARPKVPVRGCEFAVWRWMVLLRAPGPMFLPDLIRGSLRIGCCSLGMLCVARLLPPETVLSKSLREFLQLIRIHSRSHDDYGQAAFSGGCIDHCHSSPACARRGGYRSSQ